MRTILIGAVEGTDVALRAMQDAGFPPRLVATFDPATGPGKHADYVDLAPLCTPANELVHLSDVNDEDFLARARALDPDIIFVIGWSQLVGAALRAAARRFVIGFHPTPLPRLRGRAPVAWTILSGAERSGVSFFVIDEGVDTGPLLAQRMFDLDPRETAASLIGKNKAAMADLLRDLLPGLADGSAVPRPQALEGVSYGARRTAEDAQIDWSRPALEIDRLVRAQGPPYGGAFTFTRKRRLTIASALPEPVNERYFASEGQIVAYRDGQPVVLCGGGTHLRLTGYGVEGDAAFRLAGQVRFRNSISEVA
jgi:methionyl-tRNA formyltransferase